MPNQPKPICPEHGQKKKYKDSWVCLECAKVKHKNWRKQKIVKDPSYLKKRNYQSKYKISLQELELLLKKQHNQCAICKQIFTEQRKPFLDHNHITNKNRGLLCNECNLVLGWSRENETILLSAIEYLARWNQLETL